MTESLTKEMFTEQLNTTFEVRPETERVIVLELIEVSDAGGVKGWENFSLVFRGPADFYLPQLTYRMEHQRLGTFDLFIVPISRDTQGFYYEAVFNRQTR